MPQLLPYFMFFQIAGLLAALLVPRKKEKLLSGIAIAVVGVQLAGMLAFVAWWLFNGAPALDLKYIVLLWM